MQNRCCASPKNGGAALFSGKATVVVTERLALSLGYVIATPGQEGGSLSFISG